MKVNESNFDRGIRATAGVTALFLAAFFLTGTIQLVAAVLGAMLLITGVVGYCGVYSLLGISTYKAKKKKK